MEAASERPSGQCSASIELLDGVADSRPEQRRSNRLPRRQTTKIIAVVFVVYVGFLWLPGAVGGRPGEIHPVETYFGDPFAVDWLALEGPGDPAADYPRPPPMASTSSFCVGFGRLDWAESDRSPSVAHCIEAEFVDSLDHDGFAVLRESIAGDSTWNLLIFGGDIDHVEVRIDETHDLGPERIFHARRFVALLLPTGSERLRLRWTVVDGNRYECTVPAGSMTNQVCE
ncbi:MAG: hypothetical protein GY939_17265 [Actinomycetia bacterium]|nr:hypothetical protein [Actinomycetes bacterium]